MLDYVRDAIMDWDPDDACHEVWYAIQIGDDDAYDRDGACTYDEACYIAGLYDKDDRYNGQEIRIVKLYINNAGTAEYCAGVQIVRHGACCAEDEGGAL